MIYAGFTFLFFGLSVLHCEALGMADAPKKLLSAWLAR